MTGLVGQKCEPWSRQPLVQGYMEISASSCYQLCNDEYVGRPWCSQINVYTSINLEVVGVALSSEGIDSCALLGVLDEDATLLGSGAEKYHC